MPKEKHGKTLVVRVSPLLKKEIDALAEQACISTSELVRRLISGQKIPDASRHLAVIELARSNADLARLGNLLRMALMDEDFKPPIATDLETLFANIRSTQEQVKVNILALKTS